MDTTVKDIAAWTREQLDQAEIRFGGKQSLYRHMQEKYGISEFTVRNFHKGEKDNPTQNTLDLLGNALRDMTAQNQQAAA
jgi:hypothetical protein